MVVSFPDPLHVWQEDDTWVRSLADFRVFISEEGQPDLVVTVPVGFRSDYASVPKIPFIYERFGGIGKIPAFCHDYLYSKEFVSGHDRKWCDAVFHHGLLAIGIGAVTAQEMYDGVRVGGESHWKT